MQYTYSSTVSYRKPPLQPHYEYTFEGELTPALEENTEAIIQQSNNGNLPFEIVKFADGRLDLSVENDKKKRTIVIKSNMYIDVAYLLNNYFKDCNLTYNCFYKQQII